MQIHVVQVIILCVDDLLTLRKETRTYTLVMNEPKGLTEGVPMDHLQGLPFKG